MCARAVTSPSRPSFVRTGRCIEQQRARLPELYRLAREHCADLFVGEETRELTPLYDHVPLGLVDALGAELAQTLSLDPALFRRDRFSIHGCGPIGLHDDFFRYPRFCFVIVVVHSGCLGLIDPRVRAARMQPGEIVVLDPRAKHGLLREGQCADDHVYESSHAPVYDEAHQFLFLDFDIERAELRQLFRAARSAA